MLEQFGQHVITVGNPIDAVPEEEDPMSVDHYVRLDDGDIFVLRAFKVRNLLKSAEDLVPEPESND